MSTELVVAHHPIVTAVPFVLPVLLIAIAIAVIIWRDRRAAEEERRRQAAAGRDR